MIKGINRSIIEVLDTGSVYYERALLVIKPEYASAQRELLEQEAKKLLENMGEPSSLKRSKKRFKKYCHFLYSCCHRCNFYCFVFFDLIIFYV